MKFWRCWFFHDWSAWVQYKAPHGSVYNNRVCHRCGKADAEYIGLGFDK